MVAAKAPSVPAASATRLDAESPFEIASFQLQVLYEAVGDELLAAVSYRVWK